jgi:hypothetical protein
MQNLGLINTLGNVIARESVDLAEDFLELAQNGKVSDSIEGLNRFWRLYLISLEENTVVARECLCVSYDFTAWLGNFIRYVLPIFLRNGFKDWGLLHGW